MKEQLISLYDYGVWVNQRLLASAEAVTAAQFTQKVLPGYGSLQLALAHLLGAEVLWFARWQGQSPKTILAPQDLPTLATAQMRLTDLIAERRAYLAGLDEAALTKSLQWTNMRGQAYTLPLWQVILHCANHSTHHRSEVSAILTGLGHPPDSTDLLEFYLGQAGQAWKPSGQS